MASPSTFLGGHTNALSGFKPLSNEYMGRKRSRLCVIRITSHMSELKRSCILDAEDTSDCTSDLHQIVGLQCPLCDSCLYIFVSSANILKEEEILEDLIIISIN